MEVYPMPVAFPRNLQRVAVYLRKSRSDVEAEERGEGETLSRHRKALLQLAAINNYQITAIREEIVSGEHLVNRPQMQQLLQEVLGRSYDAVLCMDIDRLGRGDMIDQGNILAAFKNSSTLIITPRKVYDLDDELDEEWSEFEAFMARRELKTINKRLQRGRLMAVQEGKFIAAHPPFGYDRGADQTLIPNRDAKLVNLIFRWYVYGEEGRPMGSTKIKDRLNRLGIKSPLRHIAWEPSTVLFILKNRVYLGRISWRRSTGQQAEAIEVAGRHEPLVEPELFAAAQGLMQQRGITPTGRQPRNPLAGLIICGICGRKMVMQGGSSGRVFLCRCLSSQCNNKSSSFHFVEERLLEALQQELGGLLWDPWRLLQEANDYAAEVSGESIVSELEEHRHYLLQQKNQIRDLVENGCYDIPTYHERLRLVEEKLLTTEETLAQLPAKQLSEVPLLFKAYPNGISFPVLYRVTNDVSHRNALLKALLEKAVYRKEPSSRLDNFSLDLYMLI
jgi:site-specific DNA recombinase